MPNVLFLSWVNHHGRSEHLAAQLGATERYAYSNSGHIFLKYAAQTAQTIRILRRDRPDTVILMQPPAVAALPVLPYVWLRRKRLVLDLHSGAFNSRKWGWTAGLLIRSVGARGACIVTNEALAGIVRRHGRRVVVVHDRVSAPNRSGTILATAARSLTDYVLAPVTYASDEPIAELLKAAAHMPQKSFILTGDAPETVKRAAPENVLFTGYVSNAEFDSLIQSASVVVALTTRQDTMQRAGYEGLAYGVPVVLSDKEVLKEYFADAAVYCENTPGGIVEALNSAFADSAILRRRLEALRSRRSREQEAAVVELRRLVQLP